MRSNNDWNDMACVNRPDNNVKLAGGEGLTSYLTDVYDNGSLAL